MITGIVENLGFLYLVWLLQYLNVFRHLLNAGNIHFNFKFSFQEEFVPNNECNIEWQQQTIYKQFKICEWINDNEESQFILSWP